MLGSVPCSVLAPDPLHRRQKRRFAHNCSFAACHVVLTSQVSTSTVEAPTAASTTAAEDGLTDIYVGKGRYVKDDPKKYPGKDDMGPFIGAVGACLAKFFGRCWPPWHV